MVNYIKLLPTSRLRLFIPDDATSTAPAPERNTADAHRRSPMREYLTGPARVLLKDILDPLLITADPIQLRRVADALDREASLLRSRAADLERAAAERRRRRRHRAARIEALAALRTAWRDGDNIEAAAAALAAALDVPAAILIAMHRRDRRRWTDVERATRDRVIMQLAAGGWSDADIAARVGLSARRVNAIVAAGKAVRQSLQPYTITQGYGPL